MTTETESPQQRKDARRNRQAVVEAAIELLARKPDASMQDIAEASGLGRTTVYRHFPSREELMAALFEEVIGEAMQIGTVLTEAGDDAAKVLRELAAEFIKLGFRFRFLQHQMEVGQELLEESKDGRDDDPVRRFLLDARERGDLRDDHPVHWQQSTMQALSIAAVEEVDRGHMTAEQAVQVLGDSMIAVFKA